MKNLSSLFGTATPGLGTGSARSSHQTWTWWHATQNSLQGRPCCPSTLSIIHAQPSPASSFRDSFSSTLPHPRSCPAQGSHHPVNKQAGGIKTQPFWPNVATEQLQQAASALGPPSSFLSVPCHGVAFPCAQHHFPYLTFPDIGPYQTLSSSNSISLSAPGEPNLWN